MKEALKLALEYMNECLEEHDAKYQRHPATEAERNNILADIEIVKEALAQPEQEPLEELRQMMQIEVDRLIAAKAPKRQPLTLNEISAMEEKVYMRTTHKGKPLFKYAQALIRATEAAHNIGENK